MYLAGPITPKKNQKVNEKKTNKKSAVKKSAVKGAKAATKNAKNMDKNNKNSKKFPTRRNSKASVKIISLGGLN